MAGRYQLHVSEGSQLLALDADGGESLVDFAQSHGLEDALELCREWILQTIDERQRQTEAQKRRQQFSLLTASLKGIIQNDN